MLLDHNQRQKQQKLFIIFYLIIYSALLIKSFLDTTMFGIQWPEIIPAILLESTIIFLGIKILLIDRPSKKEIWFYIFISIGFIGAAFYTGYLFLLFYLFLILGAKNVPFRKIVQLYCGIVGTLLVITMICSQAGLVENLIYESIYGNRISFGIDYPTDFTAYIFYLVMGYCYLRREKLTYPELAGFFGLSIFSYMFCRARTNAICLMLTFAVFLYLKIRSHISDKKGSKYVMNPTCSRLLCYSMPICALCFISLTFLYHYQPNNIILITINDLVSKRLNLGSIGLERYGIHLFGSAFQMIGYGGSTAPRIKYFFLDSSYVLLLIRYGILVFLSVISIFVLSSLRAKKQKDITLLWILTLIAIQCMIEHHLLDIAYNPFLFLVFSETLSIDKYECGSINAVISKLSISKITKQYLGKYTPL